MGSPARNADSPVGGFCRRDRRHGRPGGPLHDREAGFAMLFVFLLAGCIAIALYMEMPRVVFEAQRNREQLLIDRGEQYKRAIQLYFRRFRVYPPNMDALESTNNIRFLRRRYKDPMTGEDEWRLIRGMPNGVFIDSLVYKAPGQTEKKDDATTTASTTTVLPLWQRPRPSDVTLPPEPGQPAPEEPGAGLPAEPGPVEPIEQAPQQPPVQPGQQLGVYPGMPGVPVVTSAPGIPVVPSFPGGPPTPFGQPPVQIVPGQIPSPYQPQAVPGAPIAPGSLPGQPTTGTNPALDMIRQMLTTPNPRGLAAIQVASGQQSSGPAGIAGVASKLEAEGIMVYNDRSKYNEWEFLYDARLDIAAMAQMQGPGQQTQGVNQPGIGGPPAFPGGFGDDAIQRRGRGGPGQQGPITGPGGRGGGGMTPFPMPGGFGGGRGGVIVQPQPPKR